MKLPVCPCLLSLPTPIVETPKKETNLAGHVFAFVTITCDNCGRRLGDSSPVPVEVNPLSNNPTKRIVIQIMTCLSNNLCEEGKIAASPKDEMSDSGNVTGYYCKSCRHMFWENRNIFPYTAENLGACKT